MYEPGLKHTTHKHTYALPEGAVGEFVTSQHSLSHTSQPTFCCGFKGTQFHRMYRMSAWQWTVRIAQTQTYPLSSCDQSDGSPQHNKKELSTPPHACTAPTHNYLQPALMQAQQHCEHLLLHST